jgi:hypothetical protein
MYIREDLGEPTYKARTRTVPGVALWKHIICRRRRAWYPTKIREASAKLVDNIDRV